MMRGLYLALFLAAGTPETNLCEMDGTGHFLLIQDKEEVYVEIKAEDIPKAVMESFEDFFSGYQIDKVFKGDKSTYKLEVSRESIHYMLFYRESGELIKAEQPKEQLS
ncbi:MAG: hypothetical protein AB7V25_12570 [Mangrovibacterium sp.]